MIRALVLLSLIWLLAACGPTGGVSGTPPTSVGTSTTIGLHPGPGVTEAPVSSPTTAVDWAPDVVTESKMSELEDLLDEVEELVEDTEALLDEPLP